MSDKLTDTEIKKALECCIKSSHFGECFENECPLVSEKGCKVGRETLYPYALDLINRQSSRIEKLEKVEHFADKTIETLKAEVERLNKSINLMKGAKCVYSYDGETLEFCTTTPCPISKTVDQIKAEAYKEFATKTTDKVEKVKQKYERLCKEQGEKMEEHMHIHFNGIIKIVKDLLNELVGDENGN